MPLFITDEKVLVSVQYRYMVITLLTHVGATFVSVSSLALLMD
jgi:hypothetical protein